MKNNNEEEYNPYLRQKNERNTGKIVGITITILVLIITAFIVVFIILDNNNSKNSDNQIEENKKESTQESVYKLSNNNVSKFDLEFLKLENNEKNKIYSPLSIKYALLMLNEGANGESKKQISSVVSNYEPKSYINNNNRSFANALFIKDSYKDNVKDTYSSLLKSKYNAEVKYDSFSTPNNLNNWVKDKTFNLIDDLFDDISDKNFILINALAIDMEWKNKIQSVEGYYDVDFKHEKFNAYVSGLSGSGYSSIDFDNGKLKNRKVSQIAAVVNKYDIINELGEENIKKTVTDEYNKWVKEGAPESCDPPEKTDTFVSKYMEEIKENYGHISSSTDFKFLDNEDIKVFSKELKEYDGSTLEYIGIMPKNVTLTKYVNDIDEAKLEEILDNLKDTSNKDDFDDKTITYVKGSIPLFKFDYELKLEDDLKSLGIVDVFDMNKADLSNITTDQVFIGSASHKANIEFSNDGIKAAAATQLGGLGAMNCGFEYDFDVPVKEIDLTFDKPYMFIIRDKDTHEVWFVGTVYEPIEKEKESYGW